MRYVLKIMLIITMILGFSPMIDAADVEAGKAAYLKKCATCHGQDGTPKESIAKMLKVEMRHLGSKEVQARSDAELKKMSVEGIGKMRPMKDIDAKTADDIVAYLRTFAKK